jgi:hypothetical protein
MFFYRHYEIKVILASLLFLAHIAEIIILQTNYNKKTPMVKTLSMLMIVSAIISLVLIVSFYLIRFRGFGLLVYLNLILCALLLGFSMVLLIIYLEFIGNVDIEKQDVKYKVLNGLTIGSSILGALFGFWGLISDLIRIFLI